MTHTILICLFLAYLGWRFYSRFRRSIGRQPFRPTRLKIYVAIFSVLGLASVYRAVGHPPLLLGWITGTVLGVLLGVWGLRLTRFESSGEQRFYVPNGHIGIALSLLFVGRIAYRVIAIYSHMSLTGTPPPGLGESALTFFTFELLAGYAIAYNLGVLRRCPSISISAC